MHVFLHNAWMTRRVSITEGKSLLKLTYAEYSKHGYVTSGNPNYQVWLPTNVVVTIDKTQYQCVVAVRVGKTYGDSYLAMTTNETFIWLDSKRSPKIIDANYRPSFFPPRF